MSLDPVGFIPGAHADASRHPCLFSDKSSCQVELLALQIELEVLRLPTQLMLENNHCRGCLRPDFDRTSGGDVKAVANIFMFTSTGDRNGPQVVESRGPLT
jgi:hypothetical protein